MAQPPEEISNAFLALLSRYRVKGHKVDTWMNHRFNPQVLNIDLCKMLDGLAFAGVSSVTASGEGNRKWRVLATALVRIKYRENGQNKQIVQLVVAENELSSNTNFDVPSLYRDIWQIFCKISHHGNFNPKERDPAPPALRQLHQELLLRYFSFSFPRFAIRMKKHIQPLCHAIDAYLDTDKARQSPSLVRLAKLKETFVSIFHQCEALRKLRRRIADWKPGAGPKPDDTEGLIKLWDEVKIASELAMHSLPDGPENLLGPCEEFYPKLNEHEHASEKPKRLARFVRKILKYLAVYNDFLFFAHGGDMAALRTEHIVFPKIIVGQPATVDLSPNAHEKRPGLFRADLGSQTFLKSAKDKIADWPNVRAALIADLAAEAGDPDFPNHLMLILKESIVHCEVAILQYVLNLYGVEASLYFPFVGVSKPTCRSCAMYFAAYNLVDKVPVYTSKMHDFVDIPWAIPAINKPQDAERIAFGFQTILLGQLTDHEPGTTPLPKGKVTVESTKHLHRDSASTAVSYRHIPSLAAQVKI